MAKPVDENMLASARLVSMHKYEALEAELEDAQKIITKYKKALTSIVGQTDDQMVDGVWREINSTALEALNKQEK